MPFARIVVGWIAVVALFLLWREVEYRRGGGAEAAARAALSPLLVEAALLVLFAALWFGSLGSGGGWLLFPLLATLIELPGRLRQRAAGTPIRWGSTIAAVVRIALPGVLLGYILA
jgi:uncharacterized membrane protein YfcA